MSPTAGAAGRGGSRAQGGGLVVARPVPIRGARRPARHASSDGGHTAPERGLEARHLRRRPRRRGAGHDHQQQRQEKQAHHRRRFRDAAGPSVEAHARRGCWTGGILSAGRRPEGRCCQAADVAGTPFKCGPEYKCNRGRHEETTTHTYTSSMSSATMGLCRVVFPNGMVRVGTSDGCERVIGGQPLKPAQLALVCMHHRVHHAGTQIKAPPSVRRPPSPQF
ncbi:hypothetical protein ACP70R_034594 [Stipagrostis hirtigluma subsp. patula]